jgi:hypothetical protein
MIKSARVGIFAAVALAFCSVVQADEVLYSVPLTSGAGVNTASPTNVAYSPAEQLGMPAGYLLGGDAANGTGAAWTVDSLTLWVVGYTPVGSTGNTAAVGGGSVGFEYSNGLTLYGGDIDSGAGAPISSLGTVYTGVQASYVGSTHGTNFLSTYPTTLGDYFAIWEVTFTGLDLTMGSGADWGFALSSPSHSLALNATACPDGTAATCTSSGVIAYSPNGAQYDLAATYGAYGDVNMELDGSTATPEPTTLLLFGAGVGVLAADNR